MKIRRLAIGVSCALLLAAVIAVASGAIALVQTHGNSMAPRMSAGDLVIVRASDNYAVGDVVAYTSPELRQVVLHRVVSLDSAGYTLRGDNNDFDDPERPAKHQILGMELLHIPAGGIWIERLTSPIALGILAFALLAGGSAVDAKRRRRKRTRKTPMAQHVATTKSRAASNRLLGVRTIVSIAAATICLGLALGILSWTQPTATSAALRHDPPRTVTFDYHADVPRSAAYDHTKVSAPDPIFRRLTDTVEVSYAYRGEPGTVTVTGELSTPNGWHSTVPLQPAITFTDTQHTDQIRVDLAQLERRANAAAQAIGIPATQVDVAIVPTITTENGDTFAPELHFALTPLQLSLLEGPAGLEARDSTQTPGPAPQRGTVQLADYDLPLGTARNISIALIAGPLALIALIAVRTKTNEAATIRRRYASLLLPIAPLTTPPGRPVVDVTDFSALAKLAERYGLMVMHWSRADIDTFIVHDDGITYRYRTGTRAGLDPQPAPAAAVAPAETARRPS